MQAIAAENNLAETAFYVEGDGAMELRWFTPVAEVDLCGHATLAAAHVVFQRHGTSGPISFQSKSGPLHVSKEGDWLTLDFPAQPAVVCEAPAALAAGLGVEPVACFCADDYLVVLETQEELESLSPDFRTLSELDLRGVIVTAPGDDCDFVSRFFAPKYGIDEDPVTGSAHCTLTLYWAERLGKDILQAKQLSKRGGELRCTLAGERVLISGKTVSYMEGGIEIQN